MGHRGKNVIKRVMWDAILGRGIGGRNDNDIDPGGILCKILRGGGGGGGLCCRVYDDGIIIDYAREVPVQSQSCHSHGYRDRDG